jgi:hypothetical protein
MLWVAGGGQQLALRLGYSEIIRMLETPLMMAHSEMSGWDLHGTSNSFSESHRSGCPCTCPHLFKDLFPWLHFNKGIEFRKM